MGKLFAIISKRKKKHSFFVSLLGKLKAFVLGKFQNHILFAVLVCDFVGSAKVRAGHAACPEGRGAARRGGKLTLAALK
jgi:hypothetical protein